MSKSNGLVVLDRDAVPSSFSAPNSVVYEDRLKAKRRYRLGCHLNVGIPGRLADKFGWGKTRRGPGLKFCFYKEAYSHGVECELTILEGAEWDGASGPTIDTKGSMLPSLVHDALYVAMQEGVLPKSARKRVDKLFRSHLKQAGMPFVRRRLWYWAVRLFGGRRMD